LSTRAAKRCLRSRASRSTASGVTATRWSPCCGFALRRRLDPMTNKTAVYPGSFDPFTNGHLDVVERALGIFDHLIVAVAANPDKRQPLFSVQERMELISASLEGRDRVEVASYTGLTVEFARSRRASTLVKGLRAYSDFDAELQQALMNRKLAPDVHTVFLMSSFAHIYVSSSILKDIASYGGNVADLVPGPVAKALKEKYT